MHPPLTQLPEFLAAQEALRALANATGSAWLLTNLPLDIENSRLTEPIIADPSQLCLLCGEAH